MTVACLFLFKFKKRLEPVLDSPVAKASRYCGVNGTHTTAKPACYSAQQQDQCAEQCTA